MNRNDKKMKILKYIYTNRTNKENILYILNERKFGFLFVLDWKAIDKNGNSKLLNVFGTCRHIYNTNGPNFYGEYFLFFKKLNTQSVKVLWR